MTIAHLFPATVVYVDELPDITGTLFVAPRPLYGKPCDYAPLSNWAGLVTLPDPEMTHDWQAEALDRNHRLDARIVRFVRKADAIADARAAIETELDGPCPDYIDDPVLLDHYRTQLFPSKVIASAADGDIVTIVEI